MVAKKIWKFEKELPPSHHRYVKGYKVNLFSGEEQKKCVMRAEMNKQVLCHFKAGALWLQTSNFEQIENGCKFSLNYWFDVSTVSLLYLTYVCIHCCVLVLTQRVSLLASCFVHTNNYICTYVYWIHHITILALSHTKLQFCVHYAACWCWFQRVSYNAISVQSLPFFLSTVVHCAGAEFRM